MSLTESINKKLQEEANSVQNKKGMIAKLTMRIIDNFQLTIRNVHLRVEDNLYVESPYSFGITVKEISLLTTDNNWNPVFIDRTKKEFQDVPIHKLLNIKCFGIYLNSKEEALINASLQTQNDLKNYPVQNLKYIIKPFSLQTKLIYREDNTDEIPKFDLTVEMDTFDIELSKTQFDDINSFVNVGTIYKDFQLA